LPKRIDIRGKMSYIPELVITSMDLKEQQN
jgi:hypothetical protein